MNIVKELFCYVTVAGDAYGENGYLTTVTEGIAVRFYEYDDLGQMIEERDRYTNTTTQYTYDDGGNLLQKAVYPDFYGANGTPTIITYTYGNSAWADQLTNYNGTAITYDAIGNPLNWRNDLTFTWQNGRELASYAKDGKTITYIYNSDGIRTSKTVNGVKTEYTVVDGTLRRMTCGTNILQFLDNSVIFNGTQYWYVTNMQGDVIGIIDANGEYVVEYTYDSWGNITSQTDSELARLNPFRYRGYIYDEETGLYYCQSRYYDPEVGRWLNADGYFTTGQLSTQHNMYAYCWNNSIGMSDDGGNCPRYYDPFTCPLCNKEYYYVPTEKNPARTRIGISPTEYQKTAQYSTEFMLTEREADKIAKDMLWKQKVGDKAEKIMETCQLSIYTSAIGIWFPSVAKTIEFFSNVIDTVDTTESTIDYITGNVATVNVGWDKPYKKVVEIYEPVNSASHKMMAVTIFSGNPGSALHQERHWEPYDPNSIFELYNMGW